MLEIDGNGFTETRALRSPGEADTGGELCPHRIEVHCQARRWGAKVTKAGSLLMLLQYSLQGLQSKSLQRMNLKGVGKDFS